MTINFAIVMICADKSANFSYLHNKIHIHTKINQSRFSNRRHEIFQPTKEKRNITTTPSVTLSNIDRDYILQ